MAEAKFMVKDVVTTVKTPHVVLELTEAEAEALMRVTAFVGGDPIKTRRGLIANIRTALFKAGVHESGDDISASSAVYFTEVAK